MYLCIMQEYLAIKIHARCIYIINNINLRINFVLLENENIK